MDIEEVAGNLFWYAEITAGLIAEHAGSDDEDFTVTLHSNLSGKVLFADGTVVEWQFFDDDTTVKEHEALWEFTRLWHNPRFDGLAEADKARYQAWESYGDVLSDMYKQGDPRTDKDFTLRHWHSNAFVPQWGDEDEEGFATLLNEPE